MSPKEYLHFIVGALVGHEDLLDIQETHDHLGTLLTLSLSPEDMGTIIGRGGKTIDALRTLLRIYGAKHDLRIHLRLIETSNDVEI